VFEKTTIQALVEEHTNFKPIQTGWIVGKCQLCNDYKERAGFKFEDGRVVFNCWNCSKAGSYEEFSGKMSRNFRQILVAHGVDDSEISSTVNTALFFKKKEEDTETITLSKLTKVNVTTPTIKLPDGCLKLGHPDFIDHQAKLVEYLVERRVNLDRYEFFFSMADRFRDRIIIPYYRNGHLIYWQARSINPREKKRYDNAPAQRDAIMFNMDQLHAFSPAPLFVTEGVFDAMMVDGVALLGSALNEAKGELLSKSGRRLVFVIDRDRNGRHLAESVLARGWEIAFAPAGTEDINDSVRRYGLSWTIYQLMGSIPKDNDRAQLALNLNCK